MKQFNREKRYGRRTSGRSDRNSGRSDGRFERKDSGRNDRSGSRLEMHEATCAKCGKRCEVPFKPNGTKPIYCRNCFTKNDSSRENRSDNFRSRDRPDRFESRARPDRRTESESSSGDELSEINRKLDKIMRALEIE